MENAWGEWAHVEDNDNHLIKKSLDPHWVLTKNYTFKGSPKEPALLYTNLNNARVQACIDATKWHHILSVKEFRHDQKCVLSLIERWWDTTHTFHLPNVELGFTPYDFTCITGIPIARGEHGPVPFDQAKWADERQLRSMFPHITGDDVVSGSGITCRYLKDLLYSIRLVDCPDARIQPTPAQAQRERMWLQAFFLLVLGEVFFPVSKKWVSYGWCEAVADPSMVSTYDWGTPILARLYFNLDRSSRGKLKQGQFFWTVLQVFALNLF